MELALWGAINDFHRIDGAGFDWIENAYGRRALRRNAKSGAGKGASDGFSPSCRAEH